MDHGPTDYVLSLNQHLVLKTFCIRCMSKGRMECNLCGMASVFNSIVQCTMCPSKCCRWCVVWIRPIGLIRFRVPPHTRRIPVCHVCMRDASSDTERTRSTDNSERPEASVADTSDRPEAQDESEREVEDEVADSAAGGASAQREAAGGTFAVETRAEMAGGGGASWFSEVERQRYEVIDIDELFGDTAAEQGGAEVEENPWCLAAFRRWRRGEESTLNSRAAEFIPGQMQWPAPLEDPGEGTHIALTGAGDQATRVPTDLDGNSNIASTVVCHRTYSDSDRTDPPPALVAETGHIGISNQWQ